MQKAWVCRVACCDLNAVEVVKSTIFVSEMCPPLPVSVWTRGGKSIPPSSWSVYLTCSCSGSLQRYNTVRHNICLTHERVLFARLFIIQNICYLLCAEHLRSCSPNQGWKIRQRKQRLREGRCKEKYMEGCFTKIEQKRPWVQFWIFFFFFYWFGCVRKY